MLKICFATNNSKKIEEVKAKLPKNIQLLSLKDINCSEELPETTGTIEGNSNQKATYVWENYGVNCFADDTGLEIEALDGRPGVDSAHYAGSQRNDDDNMNLVLEQLRKENNRKAQFKTVFTLVLEGKKHQFEGLAKGKIIDSKKGKKGFGYDPIFIPEGYEITFAEMELSQKNKISHRAKATQKLVSFLKDHSS